MRVLTSPEWQHALPPERPWFLCSLWTLVIAVATIAVFVGYAVDYGLVVALGFAAITLWGYVSVRRAFRGWHTLDRPHLRFAIGELTAFVMVLVIFAVTVALHPSLARLRNARDLQRTLTNDARFSSVHTEYGETPKHSYIRIGGEVKSDEDLSTLRKMVSMFDSAKIDIEWDIKVVLSQREYKGWGDDAFVKAAVTYGANTPNPQGGSPLGSAGRGKTVD
jgi:hypothetical protein